MPKTVPVIDLGPVDVRAHCPGCGASGVIRVHMGIKLERVAEDEPGTIRATMKHTPMTHDCRDRTWPEPTNGTVHVPGQLSIEDAMVVDA